MKVINFNGVWEKYRIKFIRQKNVCWEEVWALEDINFKAEKGDIVGIIGKNGAGKTTLLKLIAGMLVPDKGEIHIKGKVSALMELGAGFNPEFTGIENISLNAAIYGLSEAGLKQRMGDIVKFADLGKFIDAPIKYYSQGMYMRLAFALAIFVEPDILLIDDILAVGDEEAQQKCIKKIFELKQAGKTIVLVSHNMDMVSELCNRVILLEKGRIVREDLTTKVIPYYLETVGDRKGIAVLEKEGLRIIFNNGKVILNYNGFSLTKPIGGYVSFFVPSLNSWSSSFNLSWQVKSFGTDKIVAEGKSYEEIFSQIWTLQLEKDCLQWQIEVRGDGIKQPHIDLFFMPQYKRWQTLDKGSDFPPFASKSNWQDLGLNSCPNAMLGLSGVWQNQDCPGLVLEHENKDILFKPFNAGYEQEARVIQWSLDGKSKNLISIKIFPKKDKFTEYIENVKQKFLRKQEEQRQELLKRQQGERQQRLLEQQKEQQRLRAQHTIASGDLKLCADTETKALRLYYKDKEITMASGLHSSFNDTKKDFGLFNAQWEIQKVSERRLIIILEYGQTPVIQTWDLRCSNDNTLEIKVEFEVNRRTFLIDEGIRLELVDGYKKWMTPNEEGNFLVSRYIDNVGPIRLKENKISGVILKSESEECIPDLTFNYCSQSENRIINIYKRKDKDVDCVGIYTASIASKKKQVVPPGRYTYFEGKLVLGPEIGLKEASKGINIIELNNDRTRFVFNQGRGRIFWGQEELTKGLSVYTSVCHSGIWYDSYQAIWQVNQQGPNKIIVSGDWPHIPISQNWQIELISKNSILWQVNMEIYKEVSLEIQQMNLMLSPVYKTWTVPGFARGRFPDEYTEDYDILPFRFWSGKAKEIAAEAEILPKVCFKDDTKDEGLRAVIENTDDLYRARLLQYQKANNQKILPGKYSYFKGIIKIESQK